jgi:hypothetical protein
MMKNRPLLSFVISLFVLFSISPCLDSFLKSAHAGNCHGCKRRATISEISIHDPDNRFYVSDESGQPTPEGMAAFCSVTRTKIAEWFTSECFSTQMSKAQVEDYAEKVSQVQSDFGSGWKFPEYTFKVSFISGLPGTEPDPLTGRPIVSRFTLAIYFLGEQEELVQQWTAFGTLSTDRLSQTTGFGHYNKMRKILKNSAPIHSILWTFEKMPDVCDIRPEKQEVLLQEEINIALSNFRDALGEQCRDFNRIIVHAYQGKIINGAKCSIGPGYKVFRLDQQPITLRYKAPIECDEDQDRITVFNSCDILPIEKLPLHATQFYKEIAEKEIRLRRSKWSGTLTIEQASTFHCSIEPTKETGWQEMTEKEERIQRAFLTLTSDDFDLARIPAAGAFPQMIEVSGTINCNISQDRHIRGEAPSTECVSKGERKQVSPGNWMTDHKTTTGQASKPVKGEHVKILFAKEAGADKSQMQDLAQQMKEAAGSGNVERVQELQGQLMGMMQGGSGDSIGLRIRVMVNVPSRDEVLVTSERKVHDVCLGRLTTDDSKSDTKEIQLILPMMVDLKGNYIKGKKGEDRVEAGMEDTDHKPSGRGLEKQKCPDIEYRVTGDLNLNRRRK